VADAETVPEPDQRLTADSPETLATAESQAGNLQPPTAGDTDNHSPAPATAQAPSTAGLEPSEIAGSPATDPELSTAADDATAASTDSTVTVDLATLEQLKAEAEKLSHKHGAKLAGLRDRLNRLRKGINEQQSDLRALADALDGKIKDLLARNSEHQQQLHDKTVSLVATLQQALADGKSDDALPAWDKIQGNISNTNGKIRTALQELTAPFKGQLNELRDWKIFAATEKKRELITQMQQLVDAKIAPQDLNRQIGKLHKQWKALGRSNDNDQLWAEFKTASDKAYEPCKEYFKQRKQQMAENLKQRRALCDQLEAELGKIDPQEVDVAAINKLLASTDQAWKKHAPVEQSRIKPLQKRYYGLLNQFRKLRKSSARENAEQKQALVAEAVKLTALDDNRQAMQEAKRLQRQWKDIGPSSFKEDKKYWSEFRKACDQIFAQRDQQAAAHKEKLQQSENELRALLEKLDKVLALNDAALREAKSEFNELARQFNATLNTQGRGARNKLVERFNELKRRIDGRYRALPDKKTQALMDNLETLLAALEPAEAALLNQSANSGDTTLDDSSWQVLDSIDDKTMVKRLAQRRDLLAAPESAAEQASQAEQELRTLCIEAEIRAGVDSPEQDQSARMQIQLTQLQDGFGQSRPTAQENLRYAQHAGLLARCIGPLDTEVRETLHTRLEQVLRRLH